MDFALGKPAPALRPFVAGYGGARREGLAPGAMQALPSRYVTLILSLGPKIEITAMPDPRQGPGAFDAFVAGLHAAPATVRHGERLELVHLYLEPLGVRALLGAPAAEFASRVVELRDVLGPRAEELRERLHGAGSWDARFRLLDGALAGLCRDARPPGAEVAWAWRALRASRGQLPIADLARQLGFSRRQLGERFRDALGLAPKQAARVLRFEAACETLAGGGGRRGLAALAVACGYHDQAHLTREWRALAGCTPAEWIARELPFVQDELTGF